MNWSFARDLLVVLARVILVGVTSVATGSLTVVTIALMLLDESWNPAAIGAGVAIIGWVKLVRWITNSTTRT